MELLHQPFFYIPKGVLVLSNRDLIIQNKSTDERDVDIESGIPSIVGACLQK
jgi:hypothetical protein